MHNSMLKNLALLIVLLSSNFLSGSHMMGTEISYNHISGKKYHFTVKIYRDCRGIAFNTPKFTVMLGSNGNDACGTFNVTANRTRITDITPVCSTTTKPCYPVNTYGTGKGVEEHIYEMTLDLAMYDSILSLSGCCEFTLAVGQCCRNGAITTGPAGEDFNATATINFCNLGNAADNSPLNTNYPVIFACCNQPYQYNQGTIDTLDNDSLIYRLVHCIGALPNFSVKYALPFSYKFPFTPYCDTPGKVNCAADPNADPPEGFYFDTMNGEMVFYPINCSEVSVFAVEVVQFRKFSGTYKYIGKTRRDIQLIVENCANNFTPVIRGKREHHICEGDTICFKISTRDSFASGQTDTNRVRMNWNHGIPGGHFTVADTSAMEPEAEFCWIAGSGTASQKPYNFTVHAWDDNCPMYAETYKGFSIYVDCKTGGVKPLKMQAPRIFPQPLAKGEMLQLLDPPTGKMEYEIFSMDGRSILRARLHAGETRLQTAALPTGIYILRMHAQNGTRAMKFQVADN